MKVEQIGFVFNDLAAGQLAYSFIHETNKFLSKNSELDICAFYLYNAMPCMNTNFAKYNYSEIELFYDHLISTSCHTVNMIKDLMTPKNKYYYITDLDWVRTKDKELEIVIKSVLANKDIIKFCRSKDYYKHILDNYKTESLVNIVVENFEIEKILGIINLCQK